MSRLTLLAYHYGHGHWSSWLAHVTLSSVVHALVYSVVFRLMHRLTLGEAVILVAVVLGGLFMWSRTRDPRGW